MAPRQKKEDLLIVNRRTGKALQAAGAENGDIVGQAAIDGNEAQLWTPIKVGKNIKLRNKLSGKVLDLMHGGTEAGTWAQVWDDVADGDSQLWQMKGTVTYKRLINVQSGKVLDIVDMREDDGAPAQIWDDVEGPGQQWKLIEPAKPQAEEKPAPKRATRKPKAAAEKTTAKKAQADKTATEKPAKKPAARRTRKPKTEG